MPLYEYYCSACKWRFEMLRSMQESAADASCPECGTKARRALSVVAALPRGDSGGYPSMGGGCACGGACSCG